VTLKSLSFVPNSKPLDQSLKYSQAAVDIKLHTRRAFITDDVKNMMIMYLSVVKSIDDSDDLPPNVSKFKKDQGIQLEAPTEEEDTGNRQGDGVYDDQDQDQKFNLPINENTSPVNTAHLCIAVRKQTNRFKASLIKKAMEEHSMVGDLIGGKEYHGPLRNKKTVADKSATDMAEMMYNTATLRSGQSLTDLDANEMTDKKEDVPDEEPTEEHDDYDQAKLIKDMAGVPPPNDKKQQTLNRLSVTHESTYQEDVKNETYRVNRSCTKNLEGGIAPLDALFPTMRVPSDNEQQQTHHRMAAMHESTDQEDVQNKPYRENVSGAKNVMMRAIHHPRDRRNQTTSPALTLMQEQVEDKEWESHKKIETIPFATEGEEGINKCASM
jgi:hypothetical protein